jgi:transcriptional regulator with XRE-family HTH domain
MDPRRELGQFLRSRRAGTRPGDVGIADTGRRRVAGLRREELAVLAGVSVEHYTRIEQGRGVRPSPQVLDAIGRALDLDPAERAHVRDLAARTAGMAPPQEPASVRPGLLRLLEQLDRHPAVVLDGRMDVLAWNDLADALFDLERHPAAERNMARLVFLDAATAALYRDWELVARETVAFLRRQAARDVDDARLEALVGELSRASETFTRWWERHDVLEKAAGTKQFDHPRAGRFELDYETLDVAGTPDQSLVIYTAPEGTPAMAALERLRG